MSVGSLLWVVWSLPLFLPYLSRRIGCRPHVVRLVRLPRSRRSPAFVHLAPAKSRPMSFARLLPDVPSGPVLPLHLNERKDRRSPSQICLRSPHAASIRMCLSRRIFAFTLVVFAITATILSSRLPSRVRLLFQHRPKSAGEYLPSYTQAPRSSCFGLSGQCHLPF